jgi:quercetin dioxygenase-like cupin family protein
MSLHQGRELGWEIHHQSDQFIRVEDGELSVFINDQVYQLFTGDAIIVPRNNYHNVIAETDAKIYTIYSPPVHAPNTIEA